MLAGDTFSVVNSDKTSFDAETFTLLYLPLIGRDAFALYQLMRTSKSGKITFFLEYLNFGPNHLEEALDQLSALRLIDVYDNHPSYTFELHSPKNREDFVQDDFLKQLLLSKVNPSYIEKLLESDEQPKGQKISKKFYEIYHLDAENLSIKQEKTTENEFNMGAFELAMTDQNLTFSNENQDKLALYQMSEKFDKNWFELFNLANKSKNSDGTINISQLRNRLVSQTQKAPVLSSFDKPWQDLIRSAKNHLSSGQNQDGPVVFIQQLRKNTGGTTSAAEFRIINDLSVQGIPDEVQNILLHYVLVQRKNSVLNPTFVHQLANECLQNSIFTAEAAVTWFTNREKRKKENQEKFVQKPKLVKKSPAWSNANYVEQTSTEKQAKFAELQKRMRKENENGIRRGNS